MPLFRVIYRVIEYRHAVIEAADMFEAESKAEDTDGEVFWPVGEAVWELIRAETKLEPDNGKGV